MFGQLGTGEVNILASRFSMATWLPVLKNHAMMLFSQPPDWEPTPRIRSSSTGPLCLDWPGRFIGAQHRASTDFQHRVLARKRLAFGWLNVLPPFTTQCL